MRTATINIDGKERILCFSTRVMKAFYERFGGTSAALDVIAKGNTKQSLKESLWLLAVLLDAGDRYAKMNGLDNPKPLSERELRKFASPSFVFKTYFSVVAAITKGTHRNIELEQTDTKDHSEISPEWFIWYGLQIGLSYSETLDLPAGELRDLIAVEQIKREGAKEAPSDDEIIPDVR